MKTLLKPWPKMLTSLPWVIFAFASAESCRVRGAAIFTVEPAGGWSISAASCARVSRRSAICASRPMRARRIDSAGSSLLVVGIDQSSDSLLVVASGIIPPRMTIESAIIGGQCADEAQSVGRDIVNGEGVET